MKSTVNSKSSRLETTLPIVVPMEEGGGLGDFRFHLRRSETVLPAVWKDGMEADKDRYRTASVGMGDVQKGRLPFRQTQCDTGPCHATQPSNRRQLHTMLPERGTHNS